MILKKSLLFWKLQNLCDTYNKLHQNIRCMQWMHLEEMYRDMILSNTFFESRAATEKNSSIVDGKAS